MEGPRRLMRVAMVCCLACDKRVAKRAAVACAQRPDPHYYCHACARAAFQAAVARPGYTPSPPHCPAKGCEAEMAGSVWPAVAVLLEGRTTPWLSRQMDLFLRLSGALSTLASLLMLLGVLAAAYWARTAHDDWSPFIEAQMVRPYCGFGGDAPLYVSLEIVGAPVREPVLSTALRMNRPDVVFLFGIFGLIPPMAGNDTHYSASLAAVVDKYATMPVAVLSRWGGGYDPMRCDAVVCRPALWTARDRADMLTWLFDVQLLRCDPETWPRRPSDGANLLAAARAARARAAEAVLLERRCPGVSARFAEWIES